MNIGKERVHMRCSGEDRHERVAHPDDGGANMEWMELARAYIKIQQYRNRFKPLTGLFKGTIFPELYRPYRPNRYEDNEPTEDMIYQERPICGGKQEMPCRENACHRGNSSVPVRGGRKS